MACNLAESTSVFPGSSCASASCYGRSEDVGAVPVVVAELKLRNVEPHILLADLVERADDAALMLGSKKGMSALQIQVPDNRPCGEWLGRGSRAMTRVSAMAETTEPERKRSRRHPLFGCMKGTFWIAPGTDLTQPAFPEWADIAEESCAELEKMLNEAKAKRKT